MDAWRAPTWRAGGGVAMIFAASLTLGVATAGGMPSVIITGCERFPDPRDCPTLITRTAVDVGEMTPVRSGRTVIYTLTARCRLTG